MYSIPLYSAMMTIQILFYKVGKVSMVDGSTLKKRIEIWDVTDM